MAGPAVQPPVLTDAHVILGSARPVLFRPYVVSNWWTREEQKEVLNWALEDLENNLWSHASRIAEAQTGISQRVLDLRNSIIVQLLGVTNPAGAHQDVDVDQIAIAVHCRKIAEALVKHYLGLQGSFNLGPMIDRMIRAESNIPVASRVGQYLEILAFIGNNKVHDPRNMSFFEVDLTLNSAMIGILYLTAAMKRYEYVVSQDMLLSDQNAHRLAMNVVQQARQNQSNAVDAGRIAAARAAALEASAAYLAKRAADRAVLDARERADIARAQQQEAVRGVLDGQRHADNAAAALINARIRNLNAEAVVQLEKQKAIADKRRSEAMQHEESMRLQQKELLNELEVLKAQARHAADAAQKEGQRLQREAAQAANVAHEAWLLTPDGRAHLLAEAQKVVRERLRRQEAAERTVRLHWEQTERIRQFGEVRTIPSKAWMFIMLLLLVASGSVDFYLMWQLRPKSKGAIGKPFGALVGTAIGAEVFWSFWVWCYTAAHHSSGKPWYGQQQPAACAALYMVGYTFLFLCCSFPGLSTYAILLLFYWDTFVGSCAGNTCPFLIPGFSSYDLVAAKLFVQGLLRVVPSLAVSAVTLAAALCPLHCTPDARCVLDELQVSKLNFTDCFLHTAANSATYNGCDQTCFLDTRNRTAAIISLACAGAVLVSISWYVVYRLCSSCCCVTEFDQPSDVRRQTFEEYKVAMVHFQEMRPTQHEIYNNPMFGGA